MMVTVTAKFGADSKDELESNATGIWREYIGHPDAELPWDATIKVDLSDGGETNAVLTVRYDTKGSQ